jgi:CheY-like chemotaxis protein
MNSPKPVFLIDDDRIFRRLTTRLIHHVAPDRQVIEFQNGQEALQAFHALTPPYPVLILLDLNMPVLDGWQFLEASASIRSSLEESIPIFIVTSSIDPQDQQRAAAHPDVVTYLNKPLKASLIERLMAYSKGDVWEDPD